MIKLKSEIIIFIALISIAALLAGYNVFSVEMQKIETSRQIEERQRFEREMLEELKSRETRELAEYYQKYRPIKAEFVGKVAELSEEAQDKIVNVWHLKELTTARLEAVVEYREKLTGIGDLPELLDTFYNYELEFIESDIEAISIVLSYYKSESYSTYDDTEIKKLYKNKNLLFLKAEEELQRVYGKYNLGYLLEESS